MKLVSRRKNSSKSSLIWIYDEFVRYLILKDNLEMHLSRYLFLNLIDSHATYYLYQLVCYNRKLRSIITQK